MDARGTSSSYSYRANRGCDHRGWRVLSGLQHDSGAYMDASSMVNGSVRTPLLGDSIERVPPGFDYF